MIHPTAIIGPSTIVPEDCEIGPYSIIEDNVKLAPGCKIGPHVVLHAGVELGEGVQVHSGSVLGGDPQDLNFDTSIRSGLRVGAQTVIREIVTVNRSSFEGGQTVIGENCFLMAACHVAHDCDLGKGVVLANAVLLAGHVRCGSFAFLGGGAGIHQFCRIGESVMLGGNASITFDLPPFTMVADRNRVAGLNLIGLRRRGFARDVIKDIKQCFAAVYHHDGSLKEAAEEAIEQGVATTEEGLSFLKFFEESKRGFARPGREGE